MKKITKLMMLTAVLGCAAGAMAQSPSWTFYNPDNIRHQGTETGHTIVVKVRTAPTLADFNNDGKLEMIYGGQNDGDWDWYSQEKEVDGETKVVNDWGWHSDWNNSAYVIGFNGWDADPVRLDGKTDYWTEVTDTYGIPLGTHNFYRWIDFDNDGNLDLLMLARHDYDNRQLDSEYFALLYRNDGAEAGYKFAEVGAAPFNIVDRQAGFNPNNGWWDNNFNERMGVNVRGISFGDINADGYVDFVSQNQMGLKAWIGKGDGSFENVWTASESYREGDIKLADFDGDGVLDLIATGWSDMGYTNFFHGTGDGTFEVKNPEGKLDTRSSGVAVADFNNDGLLDVVIAGWADDGRNWTSDLYLNKGDFDFEYKATPIDGMERCVIYAFDVDNDGNNDIFVNHDQNMKLFCGNGDGTFQGAGYCNNKQSGDKSGGGFSFGDVYGRNMLDQAICYKQGDNAHVGIIPGRTGSDGNGALNEAPSAPASVKAERDGSVITITWEAATDEKTPQKSLFYNIYVKYGDVIRMLIPALEATGKLKVVQDMQTLVMGTSFVVNVPEDVATADIEIGVQAIDGVFAPSAFTKAVIEDNISTAIKTAQTKTNDNDKVYNLAGQQTTSKGINIINGKKVVIK